LRPVDPIMIGQDDGGETQLTTAEGHLEWWHVAVKGSRAVKVEFEPDLFNFPPPMGEGRVGASGHVGYYRPREGSGKGSRRVRTSEGWRLAGKERLSSREKAAPWN
jgi:hypothetical protein